MVEETNLEGNIVYKCEKCGWLYKIRKIAEKCENYCTKHMACNLEYKKYAIKLNEVIQNQ